MNRAEARERKGKQRAQIVCEILFKLINERTFAGTLPPIEFEFVSIWTDRARALAIFSDDRRGYCETIMNSIEKNWIMERAGNEIPQELKRQEFYERQRRAKERRGAEWE